MKLERLNVTGFGRFQQRGWEAGPALNLVHAPNEAGKTTLQRFIYGMLYGFAQFGYQRRYNTEDVDRYRPWAGGQYRGTLVYRLANDRRFRIERDFETGAVRLHDEATGEDISRQFQTDRRRELLFADAQFGLTGPEFESTVFVRQLGAAKVDGLAGEAIARVANLRETGSEDVSAEQALQRLREAADTVGSERAPKRPLGQALARVEALQQARSAAEEALQAAADAQARAAELRERVKAGEERLGALQREQAAAEAAELAALLARVRAEQEKLAAAEARLAEYEPFADFRRDEQSEAQKYGAEVRTWHEQVEQALEALTAAEARLRQANEMLAAFAPLRALGPGAATGLDAAWESYRLVQQGLARRRADLADRQGEQQRHAERLAAVGISSADEPLTAVRAWELRLEQAEQQLRQTEATVDTGRIAELEREVAEHRRQAGARRRLWLVAAGVALVAAVGLGLAVSPVAFAGAVLAPVLWLFGEQAAKAERQALEWKERELASESARHAEQAAARAAAEQQLAAVLAEAGVASAAELRDKLAAARDAAAASERIRDSVKDLTRQVQEQEDDLATRRSALLRFLQAAAETARLRAAASARDSALADAAATLEAALPEAALPAVTVAGATEAAVEGAGAGATGAAVEVTEVTVDAARQQWQAWQHAEQARRDAETAVANVKSRHDEAVRRRDAARQALQGILERAGCTDFDSYLKACAARVAYDELQQVVAKHREVLAATVDGRSVDELVAAQAAAAEAAAGFAGESRPLADVQRLVADAADDLHRLRSELRGVESEVETRLRAAPDLARVEAELEEARAEAERRRGQRAALERAQALLAAVIEEQHRDFAPRLNRLVGDLASRFTDGRYSQVRVSEDLSLMVEMPGDNSLRPLDNLSAGTVDQFYFAMRLAVADLIGRPDEPLPLFLDDTFVQADADRLAACLDYIGELAADGRQVWLFTCHDREADALRNLASARGLPLTELAL